MGEKTDPHNQEGQPPTRTSEETVERLEQKKNHVGGANRERIEDQEREVGSGR